MFAGIGNALLTVPLVRQVKKLRPDWTITALAGSPAIGEVFSRLNEVDNVIVAASGASGLLKTGLGLRLKRCDVFLIPSPSRRWQYLLMAACIGARRTVMHTYTEQQSLIRRALRFETIPARYGLHDVHQNLLLLNVLTPDTPPEDNQDTAPVFPLCQADHEAADALLHSAGITARDGKPIIVHAGCGPTALAAAKRWPPEHCNLLLRAIRKQTKRLLIVIEGPDEPGLADEVLACGPVNDAKAIRLRGNLGISAALLQRAGVYIGSDSGLAHLSAAVGTPPVTLFGPADPERMCPFGYRHLVVQAKTPTCRACNRYPWHASQPKISCDRHYACMRDITTEDILEKALPLLQK
jgi:ADP-heptose:LPS heptosyltransferase